MTRAAAIVAPPGVAGGHGVRGQCRCEEQGERAAVRGERDGQRLDEHADAAEHAVDHAQHGRREPGDRPRRPAGEHDAVFAVRGHGTTVPGGAGLPLSPRGVRLSAR